MAEQYEFISLDETKRMTNDYIGSLPEDYKLVKRDGHWRRWSSREIARFGYTHDGDILVATLLFYSESRAGPPRVPRLGTGRIL